ncbi:hypothetical protein B5F07_07760 [Lachnoclostridium sp. An169]|uniref:hypothetical protein n=1 Tax=Lachnoclostridium sp. An169 TaxID=1965569 RepID=UPI000B36B291|nr:hypothetical protein [Lachnoclostridium sp. An169]OUP84350.1 hypothetical protein B5F07_07760 [Lachnoclostridium sp. An169]
MECQIHYDLVPPEGILLAYFRMGIVFSPYRKTGEMIEVSPEWADHLHREEDPLLELHLFDEEREYRLFRDADGKYAQDVVSDTDQAGKDLYTEEMYLEKPYASVCRKLRVVNYISYTDEGMLEITNYRLSPAESETAGKERGKERGTKNG